MNLVRILLFATIVAVATAQCVVSEHDALIELYNAAGGPLWNNQSGWDTPASDHCTWYGVTCNHNGRVVGLDLTDNNLQGFLPESIGCFTFIKSLLLGENALVGLVPADIGLLVNMKYLTLAHNQLTGPLPAELCQAVHLQYIYLSHNLFTGVIPLCYATAFEFVKEIHLECNELEGPLLDFSQYDYIMEVRSRCNDWDVLCPLWTQTDAIVIECQGLCEDCPTPPVFECPPEIVNECGTYVLQ